MVQIAPIEVLWEHIGHLPAKAIIFMSMEVLCVLVINNQGPCLCVGFL